MMDELAAVTGQTGAPVRADPAELLTGRAGFAGLRRQGRISAGGATRLLRSADGWCAVTLSRPEDAGAVPAILGALGLTAPGAEVSSAGALDSGAQDAGAWRALDDAARAVPAKRLAAAAQLLGVPAAAMPTTATPATTATPPGASPADARPAPPWRATRIAAASPAARLDGAVVADLSAMWAGPLCAHLLGVAGANVIKVESASRPDGARSGDRRFFDWLQAGHRSLLLDFRTEAGRAALGALLDVADVVIEASRPRALANLGLDPGLISHRDGQVWLSITGYGRGQPDLVAFGDDAAVAGGLVGWHADDPVFCADAIADPLTGVCGALAVARSLAAGGGHLIDLSMRETAAAFAAALAPDHGPHEIARDGAGWRVGCPYLGERRAVAPPRRPEPAGRAAASGADTAAVLAWLGRC